MSRLLRLGKPARSIVCVLISVLALSACHSGKKSRSNSGMAATYRAVQVSPPPAPSIEVPREAIPYDQGQAGQIPLKCAAQSCPPQVGLLLFYLNERDERGNQLTNRCTGTVAMQGDLVLAAGHCDKTAKGQGYFITQFGQSYKITGVQFKEFTPVKDKYGQPTDSASGRPDVILFRLERPVESMRPLMLATGAQTEFNRLIAYVVNDYPKSKGYIIESVTCQIRRHEYFFPYSIGERPDMIRGFDCQTKPGNSGAALFAPGSDLIQAVYLGYGNTRTGIDGSRTPPQAFGSKWIMSSTNVRCVDFSGADQAQNCVAVTWSETKRRFKELIKNSLYKLERQGPRNSSAFPTGFEPKMYPLAEIQNSYEPVSEIVYYPVCRKSDRILTEVQIPHEKVRVTYSEWGVPRLQFLDQVITFANVELQKGDFYRLRAYWQPPFGKYDRDEDGVSFEDQHPRSILGPQFDVKLPICPKS